MLSSPGGRTAEWVATVQEAARALVTPTVSPGLVLPSLQARMDKGAAGNHEDGGWPGLPSSLRDPAAGGCAGRGADRGSPQGKMPLKLGGRGAPWPPPQPHPCYLAAIRSALLSSRGRDSGTARL